MEAVATGVAIAAAVLGARASNEGSGSSSESVISQFVVGGAAAAFTSALLNPMDVVKTRMQLAGGRAFGSTTQMVARIWAQGGAPALWSPGLAATMVREMFNCSARVGLYVPVRNALSHVLPSSPKSAAAAGGWDGKTRQTTTLAHRALAALLTGSLGSVLSNPVDVVKVRLLVSGDAYSSTYAAYPELLRAEGLRGAFRGVGPSTLRGASVACGELATYDQAKQELKRLLPVGAQEGAGLHVAASLITGVVATTAAAPFDVIKTRAMAGHSAASSVELLAAAVRTEGPHALFRGWVPAYCRLGPHALICLPVFDQLRAFVGVGYL